MARATAMTYQVWDDETGNVIASYASREAAITFLHGMLAANGPSGVAELALIEYPSDGSDPITVLEGADLLAQTSNGGGNQSPLTEEHPRPTSPLRQPASRLHT